MIHTTSVIVQYNIDKGLKQVTIANEKALPTDYTDYKLKKIRVNSCNSWARKNLRR